MSSSSRIRTLPVLIALVATNTLAQGQEPKRMAITFDDLPFAYQRNLTMAEQRQAVTRVLATLDKHRVTATVFVIGRTVTDENRSLVDAFVRAGHGVGNHSFSHRDLGVVAADDYIQDIQKGEEAIKPWLKGVQYFRYPFLRQGNTVEKRDAVLNWMASRGIAVAPVTIDNNDYLYNQQLVDAKVEGRAVDVRDEYLDHMMQAAAYYDAKGRARVGRAVDQVLLLHMNYLNSLYLDDLLQRFREQGWFVHHVRTGVEGCRVWAEVRLRRRAGRRPPRRDQAASMRAQLPCYSSRRAPRGFIRVARAAGR
jgi:peptidoglycan-N-acetylglucosamine deacetylase